MQRFKAVFFDLDHTLWDFEANSSETIGELLQHHGLLGREVTSHEQFMDLYRTINKDLWDRYHANAITKDELRIWRFQHSLKAFGVDDHPLSVAMADKYLEICPTKTALFHGAEDVLKQLKEDHTLHIITNGFKEVQYLKLRHSGILDYFDKIHISEEVGWKKPEPEIFWHALREAGVKPAEAVMIGDNPETDIMGALQTGIRAVLFDPDEIHPPMAGVWKATTLSEVAARILNPLTP